MSLFPVTISIGDFNILLHTVLEFVGIFIGVQYFIFLRKKQGDAIDSNNRLIIMTAAIFGAVFGSRLVGCFEDIHQLFHAKNILLYIAENKSIVGGLLGALWAVEIVKICIKEKKKSGDLFVFPLILAMIIGRIGCFSMGVYETTFGIETSSFLGLNLGDGIERHPVMLYEILFLITLWIGLYFFKRKRTLQEGSLFQYFMISYLFFRFFIEILKPNNNYFLHLGTIQIACLLGLIYYFILKMKHKNAN